MCNDYKTESPHYEDPSDWLPNVTSFATGSAFPVGYSVFFRNFKVWYFTNPMKF